jgi:hypothetical protein
MNKFVAVLKKIALEMILNEEVKKNTIIQLNKKFNLPMVSEKTEAEFLESMWDAMQEALKGAISKEK